MLIGAPLSSFQLFPHCEKVTPQRCGTREWQEGAPGGCHCESQVKEVLSTGQSLYTVDEALLEELRPDVILTQDLCQVCSIDLQARTLRSDLFSNILVNYVLPPYF